MFLLCRLFTAVWAFLQVAVSRGPSPAVWASLCGGSLAVSMGSGARGLWLLWLPASGAQAQ